MIQVWASCDDDEDKLQNLHHEIVAWSNVPGDTQQTVLQLCSGDGVSIRSLQTWCFKYYEWASESGMIPEASTIDELTSFVNASIDAVEAAMLAACARRLNKALRAQ
jgi:hypothetical protein